MSGFVGAGTLYADIFDANGNSTGFRSIGNCTSFVIQEAAEIKERISRQKDTYGQVLDSVSLKTPATLTVVLDELETANFVMALMGESTTTSVVGSTTSTSITPVSAGYWYDTGLRELSALSAENESGSAFTSGLDLFWDSTGWVKFTDDNGIYHQDETVLLKYTQSSYSVDEIKGGTNASLHAEFVMDGVNKVDNEQVRVTVYDATLRPESGVEFISEDFIPLQLTGTLNTPTGYDHPYKVERYTTSF